MIINPTIGRRVLLFVGTAVLAPKAAENATPPAAPRVHSSAVPFDAGIVFVHGEQDAVSSLINVGYRDHDGVAQSMTSVPLLDRAKTTTDAHGKDTYAVWMEYQFEQAQRAAAPKEPAPPAAGRAPDVPLVKLEDNGVPVGQLAGDGVAMEASD